MAQCTRTITANVVALDQPFFWNRLGAVQPQGMMYALRRDPGEQVRRIETAKSPIALAYSALSNAVYAGHEDGTIVSIDAASGEVRGRVATAAGLRTIGFSRDGRWGFVLNPRRTS
jgi:NADPH-dependent curcumin reductase CurA